MKSCLIKDSLNSSCQKNKELKKLLIKIAPTSIYIERFTGPVSDWNMLNNDWPNQKFNSLTLIWGSLCCSQILNPCIPRLV